VQFLTRSPDGDFHLSARIFQKPHIPSLPNFLCLLPIATARSSSGDVAICYVFPVLWMTSCLPVVGQAQATQVGRSINVTRQGQHEFDTVAYIQTDSPCGNRLRHVYDVESENQSIRLCPACVVTFRRFRHVLDFVHCP